MYQRVGERLLRVLSQRLKRDVLELGEPGILIDKIASEKKVLIENLE